MNLYNKNRILHTHKHAIMSFASAFGVLTLLLTFVFVAPITNAAPNYQMNYQGKLTNATNVAVADGTYNMRFWLTTTPTIATTSAIWTESLTGTNRVQVTNGLFSVMLGSTSPLTGVDFNQTLYLGVEIGSTTGSAVWDGEMSPRKVLGTVPAAFEANKLDGIDSTQFVRNDATNTIASSSPNTLLTLTQNGVGDIFNLFDGTTEVFTMTDGGRMGLGTTSPSRLFTMQGGDFWLGGNMTATGSITASNLTISASSTLGFASSTALTVSGTSYLSGTIDTTLTGGVLTTDANGIVSASTTIGDAYISDSLTLTTSTGLPISTGVSGLGTNVATFLATPSSANLAAALTDETGSLGGGLAVFSNAPTFTGTTAFNALTVTSTSTLGFASSTAFTSGNTNLGNATSTSLRTLTLGVNGDYITDITGSGLSITNGVLNASGLSNWTDQGTYLTPLTATDGISLSGSSTAQFLTMVNSTSTAATSTNLFASIFTATNENITNSLIGNGTTTNATSTNLRVSGLLTLGGDAITDITGAGLQNTGNALTCITATGAAFGCLTAADWTTFMGKVASSSIDTSSELAALVTDETGSGSLVFSGSPVFTGGAQFAGIRASASSTLGFASSTALTVSGTSYLTNLLATGSSTIGGGTGATGLTINGGATTTGRLVIGTNANTDIFMNSGSTTLTNGNNVAIGNQALTYFTTGATYNIGLGYQALYGSSTVPMTGDYNFAAGYLTLSSNTTGNNNNAIGLSALNANTTGNNNNAIGPSALNANTTGNYNNALGLNALRFNTTGIENNAIGHDTLFYNITGSNNTAFGQNALTNNRNGSHNTGIGFKAGFTIGTSATSSFNTYIGYQAGYSQTQGDYNLVLGTNAGYNLGTATSTTMLGAMANTILANISSSTALGAGALLAQSNTMVLGGTGLNAVDIVSGTSTPWAKLSIMNNFGSTNALFDIATTTSSAYATSSIFRVNYDGKVGVGTTTPYANFTVAGTMGLTGAFYDRTASAGTNGMVLQTTGTGVQWVATSTLGITSGSSFSDSAGLAGLLSDETGTGFAVFSGSPVFTGGAQFAGIRASASSTLGYASSTALTVSGTSYLTNLLATGSSTIGGGTGATGLTINGTATSTNLKVTSLTASRALFTGADNLFTTTGTSQYLIDSLSDETGTGNLVFSASPTFTGGAQFAGIRASASSTLGFASSTALTVSGTSYLANLLATGSSTIGGGTGATGLTINGGATTTGNANILGTLSLNRVQALYVPDQTNFDGTLIVGNGGGSLSHSSGSDGMYNTSVGLLAGTALSTGNNNSFFGNSAGNANSTGSSNSFFGGAAGFKNTGSSNSFFGNSAGQNQLNGSGNVAIGINAGLGVTSNSYSNNTIVGGSAASALTTGSNNLILGSSVGNSGTNLTTGSNNILIGYNIGATSTNMTNGLVIGNLIYGTTLDGTGTTYSTGNIGIGTSSPYAKLTVAGTMGLTGAFYDRTASAGTNGMVLQTTGTGVQWVATSTLGITSGSSFSDSAGLAGLLSDETGTGFAVFSGSPVFTGGAQFAGIRASASSTLGFASSTALTVSGTSYLTNLLATGSSTIGGGTGATGLTINGGATTTGRLVIGTNANTDIFMNSGSTTLTNGNNVAIGNQALTYFTTGATYNIGLGYQALYGSSTVPMTGDYNFAAGYLTLSSNTTGNNNNAIGLSALNANTTGNNNNAIGPSALNANTTGNYNNALGLNALRFNTTGIENNAIGHDTLFYNITGSNNTAFGQNALTNNRNGSHNTGIGFKAGFTIGTSATSSFNTYIGYQAGYSQTQGDYNLVLGTNAGYNLGTATSTTMLGAMANTILANISSSTALGAGALLAQSNTMVLGGTGLNAVDIVSGTSTPWAKLSIMNNFGSTNALFDIATTTSSAYATSSIFRVNYDGKVGVGTTTPYANFTVAGTMGLTGAFYDRTASAGTNGMVLQTTGTGVQWVATSTLGITSGSSFSDSAGLAALLSDETGTGFAVFSGSPVFTGGAQFAGIRASASSTLGFASSTALTVSGTSYLTNLLATGSSTIGGGTGATGLTINGTATSTNLKVTSLTASRALFTGADNLFTTTGTSQYLIDSLSDETGTGNLVFSTNPLLAGFRSNASSTIGDGTATGGLTINGGATTTGNSYIGGNLSIGTTSASAHLTIDGSGLTGSVVGGMKEYLGFTNSTLSAVAYGDETYITNVPTATSTLVGKMIRIADTSALGNTVRGLEVQAYRGTNTKGENTGIAGFGRTFGVRGSTQGDAGSTYLPAGMFAETEGTTQGNALRAYSGSITSENLVYFFHDTSNFTGTGLKMDFGNAGGSFAATSTAKFLDFKVGGTSKFYVSANGSTTIGDGTVSAGLRIPYGGICVDNDGSCVSTTTGQIRSVTSALGNSDLAEMYFSSQTLHAGEIVSLDGGLSVKRASESTEENIIGVVSTKPGMTLGFDDTSLALGESGYPIGLKGRVPIKLSTENGPIMKGDRIALSSIPGVGMKATEGSRVVGIALEDYNGTRAYSSGFLNQFGDDMLKERVITRTIIDPKTQDGCYNGGGNALGEAPCVAKSVTTTTVISENPEEQRSAMLNELTNQVSVKMTNAEGTTYEVGQVLMFIELAWYQTSQERLVLSELSTTSPLFKNGETLWDRVKALATNFVDGVLSVTGLKADRVEVKNELCVDGVCVTADDLRAILQSAHNNSNGGGTSGGGSTGGEVTGGNTSGGSGNTTGGTSGGGDTGAGSAGVTETPTEPAPAPTEVPPVVAEPAPSEPVV